MEKSVEVGKPTQERGREAQKPLCEGLSHPKVALHRKKGVQKDVFCLSTDGHRVGFSSRETVIEHPAMCRFKGSPMDKRKTFHNWSSFLAYVDKCKLNITQEVMAGLEVKHREVRKNAKY